MSLRVSRCQSCRHQILDAFAAIAGLSLKPLPRHTTAFTHAAPLRQSHRAFRTSIRFHNEPQQSRETTSSVTSTPPSPPQSPSNQAIPWYLQVETPLPPAPISAVSAHQDIPPLPTDAPPILLPILTHLSSTMGLDNLSIIDLRDIHPPPALGANLLMVLGTARSYKHLNTSADRFCRWLRTNYKLRPYADGLLGRNELKLKLRRKARRQKLAQSVGNTVVAQEGSDDGITTGWICVNLGSVEGAKLVQQDEMEEQGHAEGSSTGVVSGSAGTRLTAEEQEEVHGDEEEYVNPLDDDGYVGFGSKNLSPRIVVQMFTEEKRVEMDLEGLWDFRRQRKSQKNEKAAVEARGQIKETDTGAEAKDFQPWSQ